MKICKHARTRIQQRSISVEQLDTVIHYGTKVPCGYYMREIDVREATNQNRKLGTGLKGLSGRLVVVNENTLVTAYFANRKKQRRLLISVRK